jgi:hypothetical protein
LKLSTGEVLFPWQMMLEFQNLGEMKPSMLSYFLRLNLSERRLISSFDKTFVFLNEFLGYLNAFIATDVYIHWEGS